MNLIVARGINGEIGANNELLWKIPEDMQFFKETTKFNTVVMGRKTWESIGSKPLPNRKNIVITHNPKWTGDVNTTYVDIFQFLKLVKNSWDYLMYGDIYIIGGAEIYKQLDRYINVMYITEVEQTFPEADSFFYGLSGEWDIEKLKSGISNGFKYTIYKHTRRGV